MGESWPLSFVQTALCLVCTVDLGQDPPIQTCLVNKTFVIWHGFFTCTFIIREVGRKLCQSLEIFLSLPVLLIVIRKLGDLIRKKNRCYDAWYICNPCCPCCASMIKLSLIHPSLSIDSSSSAFSDVVQFAVWCTRWLKSVDKNGEGDHSNESY